MPPQLEHLMRPAAYLVVAYAAWRVLWGLLRWVAIRQTTALNDISATGRVRKGGRVDGIAVVAGGSLAGLLAAQMLSFHFQRVMVIEPDENVGGSRRGRVGQSTQLHGFNWPAKALPEALFGPAFLETALQRGARVFNHGAFACWFKGFRPDLRPDEGTTRLSMSRMGYENLVRAFVKQTPEIVYLRGTVKQLEASRDGTRISSVHYLAKDCSRQAIDCDLFVDASGVARAGTKWLASPVVPDTCSAKPKWGPAAEHWYHPHVHYSTLTVECSPELLNKLPSAPGIDSSWKVNGWHFGTMPDLDKDTRQSFVFSVEENKIDMVAMSRGEDQTPRDLDSFVEFLQESSLVSSGTEAPGWIVKSLELLRDAAAQPGGPKVISTQWEDSASVALNYRDTNLPTNFAAIGDAYIKLNPALGQGVSSAATAVATLDRILRQSDLSKGIPADVGERYFALSWGRLLPIFQGNMALDSGSEMTDLGNTPQQWLAGARRFAFGYFLAAHKFRHTALVFSSVAAMAAPSIDLFHPMALSQALWTMWKEQ